MTEEQATAIIELLTGIQKDLHVIASNKQVNIQALNVSGDIDVKKISSQIEDLFQKKNGTPDYTLVV